MKILKIQSTSYPGIPTTIETMGVNITTIAYLRVLIIEIGSTIILMVVEAQGIGSSMRCLLYCILTYMGFGMVEFCGLDINHRLTLWEMVYTP